MIRRQANGQFLLIAQMEHARLSGKLIERIGNGLFAPPLPHEPTVQGASMHDSGWPLHDEQPTLNAQNLPRHVFEMPLPVALRIWAVSADRAQALHDYTGLLVSLHSLGLSSIPASRDHTPREAFELNKFQHREIERQEQLRQRLGLRTDLPLKYGVAEDPAQGGVVEEQLTYNFRLLQLADRLSLVLCCSEPLFDRIEGVRPRPGTSDITLTLGRASDGALIVDPWPFDGPRLSLRVPYRPLPARALVDEAEYRRLYAAAPVEQLSLELCQG